MKHCKLNSPKPNLVPSRWFGSQISEAQESSTSAYSQSEGSSKPSNIDINTRPHVLQGSNQASIESAFFGDSKQFSNTIAKFVLQSGLPFNVVEHSCFKNMLKEVRYQPINYRPPTRKQIANEHLDTLYATVNNTNEQALC